MKNLHWILIGLLTLLVGNLYVKLYTSGSSTPADNTGTARHAGPLKLAYVNADSILVNFAEFNKEKTAMESRQAEAEKQLQTKVAALEKEAGDIQRRAQAGYMTPNEIQAEERKFAARQQLLLEERDQLAKKFLEEGSAINEKLQTALFAKLEALKAKEGYDFIFSYSKGGQILTTNPEFDVTKTILDALNSASIIQDTTAKK